MHNQLAQRLFVGLLIMAADGVKVSPTAHQKKGTFVPQNGLIVTFQTISLTTSVYKITI